jgi:hypothetical protein
MCVCMCMQTEGVEMLTPIGGFNCVDFLNPIHVVASVRRKRLALFIGPK